MTKQELEKNIFKTLTGAYEISVHCLKLIRSNNIEELLPALENRERAINIAQSFSENLSLYQTTNPRDVDESFNNQLNQLIKKISSLDGIIINYLTHEKNKTQFEIAKTFRDRENFKGYNLNNLK